MRADLLPAWAAVAGPPLGLAAASASDGAWAVVAVTAQPLAEADRAAVRAALTRALGGAGVDLVAVHGAWLRGPTLRGIVRQWVHQVAQGSGRGVGVEVAGRRSPDGRRVLDVRLTSLDSAAREVAMRLGATGSGHLAALRTLLGYDDVTIRDVDA